MGSNIVCCKYFAPKWVFQSGLQCVQLVRISRNISATSNLFFVIRQKGIAFHYSENLLLLVYYVLTCKFILPLAKKSHFTTQMLLITSIKEFVAISRRLPYDKEYYLLLCLYVALRRPAIMRTSDD